MTVSINTKKCRIVLRLKEDFYTTESPLTGHFTMLQLLIITIGIKLMVNQTWSK